jgi:class 3 adenylate cyclase
MTLADHPTELRFGPFTLDLRRSALFANGRGEIPLRPRSFALLRFLIDHAGILVSRETIRKAIWPNVFVVDDNITQCVGDVRRALGTAAPEFLRTIPRRGYLFSGQVEVTIGSTGSARTGHVDALRRCITSMFTDLQGYTLLAERLEPRLYASLLEGYLSQMIAITRRHRGSLLRVTGDGLNVMFGMPGEWTGHAARAVACAIALDAFSERFRSRWRALGVEVGVTRIGINTGPAIVGSFGAQMRGGYTAHGETINIASRLEEANRILGTRICVSGSVFQHVPGLPARVSGSIVLREGQPPVAVYELIRGRSGSRRRSFGASEPTHHGSTCDRVDRK